MKLKTEWADVRVSNTDWDQRPYDIAATAHTESGAVTSVNSGSVNAADGTAASLASFHSNGGGSLTVNYQTGTDRAAILAAVEDFLAALKEEESPGV